MSDPQHDVEEHFREFYLDIYKSLPEAERKCIDAELNRILRRLKETSVNGAKTVSTNTLFVAFMYSMYYDKFGETPYETALGRQWRHKPRIPSGPR